jgi:hypothetical protein
LMDNFTGLVKYDPLSGHNSASRDRFRADLRENLYDFGLRDQSNTTPVQPTYGSPVNCYIAADLMQKNARKSPPTEPPITIALRDWAMDQSSPAGILFEIERATLLRVLCPTHSPCALLIAMHRSGRGYAFSFNSTATSSRFGTASVAT